MTRRPRHIHPVITSLVLLALSAASYAALFGACRLLLRCLPAVTP